MVVISLCLPLVFIFRFFSCQQAETEGGVVLQPTLRANRPQGDLCQCRTKSGCFSAGFQVTGNQGARF
ncbi:hypothetical protein ATANTOWER_025281 [Ataeniobius toweri]|uniref:Secreted protein n=1 Tax=Ataeniobius toweri TaxID=208326 RepID=A0ABU7B5C7_9TELE|nr:hypothetical protein [Ataeniobius toweri]